MGRWLRGLAALVVLALGLAGLAVDHLPPSAWPLPVGVGPLTDGQAVLDLRRRDHEVRLDVGTPAAQGVVRLVAADDPDATEQIGRYALAAGGGTQARAAVAAAVARAEAAWVRGPRALRAPGVKVTAWQEAEEATLQAVLVAWLAAMILLPGAWRSALPRPREPRARALAGLAMAAAVLLPLGVTAALGSAAPWHANLHGFERVAAVAHGTPPATAGLGLLHGHGWYVVVQGLDALCGGWLDPFRITALLMGALGLAVGLWARLVWDDDRAGFLACAWFLLLPLTLRLAGSVSMYVPATLAVVVALLLFELHLREDRDATFLLALPPAVLAVQTRAELAVVLPAWVAGSMLLRRPGWLRTAWRRPAVGLGLAGAALACLPRGVSLLRSPPPSDLRRWALDPVADPRVLVVGVVALLAACLLAEGRVRWAVALGAVAAAVGGAVAVVAAGGALERTWQVHAVFDPWHTSPFVALLPVGGAAAGARARPRLVAWLVLAWCLAVWLVLAQYDSLSTYVRTGLLTSPLLAVLAGGLAGGVGRHRLTSWVPVVMGSALLPVFAGWAWVRYPTQQVWDALVALRARAAPGDVVVWPAPADLPGDLRSRGFHTERLALQPLLPDGVRAVGLEAWRAGAVPEGARTWLLVTPDCWRPVLHPRTGRAWTAGGEVAWTYLDVSDVTSAPRIRFDLADGYADPACAEARALATREVWVPLSEEVSGSIYETTVPPADDPGWVGVARLPPRRSSAGASLAAEPGSGHNGAASSVPLAEPP